MTFWRLARKRDVVIELRDAIAKYEGRYRVFDPDKLMQKALMEIERLRKGDRPALNTPAYIVVEDHMAKLWHVAELQDRDPESEGFPFYTIIDSLETESEADAALAAYLGTAP
jgi:hypothetical protein